MSEKTYKLEIVTPERKAFSEQVAFSVFPGTDGELGILADHAPLVTRLCAGVIKITRNGIVEQLAIAGGFLEVRNNDVSVVAETAEFGRDIDKAGALKAKTDAEAALKNALTDGDRTLAELQLRKALVRIMVAETV